jgi:hypothetical protein
MMFRALGGMRDAAVGASSPSLTPIPDHAAPAPREPRLTPFGDSPPRVL